MVKDDYVISIHAPVKGATQAPRNAGGASTNFNPRSREGSDSVISCAPDTPEISIHAPVKGATSADR